MNYLFVHQNFPGQFKHIAPTLAKHKDNRVIGFAMNNFPSTDDLQVISYKAGRGNGQDTHELLREFETKVIRGNSAYRAAIELKKSGFRPDVIIAHPGWGESLFLKDVWPDARLGIYCEFFYKFENADVGFDPEFPDSLEGKARYVRMKNVNNMVHMEMADAGISPTLWQASTFPNHFRERISVIHDGIDTGVVAPKENAFVTINGTIRLDRKTEIITFVNRNLEPYRGYHVFMRALPQILKSRPGAHVIVVGGDGVSYGQAAPSGATWKQIYLNEVKNDLDISRVHFVGNLSYRNFVSLLQVSSVHVYLTYPFVLSWSLLEAMSAGCAIVASDTPPVKEVMSSGLNGLLVNFFDHEALAGRVIELLSNPERRRVLGANARDLAVKNYDLQSVCLPKQLNWVRQLATFGR
jgi:glycosyltransferase involved in cell wall biosynthesis